MALPGEAGELGICPDMLLMTRIKTAPCASVQNQTEEELVFVAGGPLEVQPNLVTGAGDTAIRGHDLTKRRR